MPFEQEIALKLDDLRGNPVTEIFPALVAGLPEIEQLRFEIFTPGPSITDRVAAALENSSELERARQVMAAAHVPLWEAVAFDMMHGGKLRPELFDSALVHTFNPPQVCYSIARDENIGEQLTQIRKKLPSDAGLAACSIVSRSDDAPRHLPMLDLCCPVSETNTVAVKVMLQKITRHPGLIVTSGRSYHYYGLAVLTACQWLEFLARALLLAPYTDSRFIAHRLLDGQCRLRIYAPGRSVPVVAEVIHG
jgi:hypothetical protein